jgi:hypothetical protein
MCSPWFPPRDPPVGSALPSTGSSGASSPASWVLWRCATPWLPFAALRCLRLAIPDAASVLSLPAVPNAQPRARGSSPVPSTGIIPSGDAQGLPGSQGTLLDLCRVLRPRPDRTHLADDGVPMLPPFCPRRRLPRVVLSRLNRTALALAVYASSSPLRCRRRKTRFRWLARPCRVGLVTHRVPTEGFRDHPGIPSSFPELSWRKDSLLFRLKKYAVSFFPFRCPLFRFFAQPEWEVPPWPQREVAGRFLQEESRHFGPANLYSYVQIFTSRRGL